MIVPIFLTAIQQAPAIAKIIWPVGTLQRELIEIGELYNQLSTVVQALGPRIQAALAAVEGKDQDDVSGFLAFAQQGAFSKPRDQWPDVANDTRGLLVGFTAFLVSEALLLGGWHVTVALGVNPLNMSGPGAECPYWQCDCGDKFLDLGCVEYDSHWQCKDSYWWYGKKSNSAYTLSKDPYNGYFHSGIHNEKNPNQLMATIFEQNWSSGELLLENAGLCVLQSAIRDSFTTPAQQAQLVGQFAALNSWTYDARPCDAKLPSRGFYIDQISKGRLRLNHPNDTSYDFMPSPQGGMINFNCTSQMNLTVLQDWASVWYLHRQLT